MKKTMVLCLSAEERETVERILGWIPHELRSFFPQKCPPQQNIA